MKHTFTATFCWANGTAQMDVEPFEVESAEEVISKISELIASDSDAAGAERFFIESENTYEDSWLSFEYEVERRHYYLRDEKNKMLDELRPELDILFGTKETRKMNQETIDDVLEDMFQFTERAVVGDAWKGTVKDFADRIKRALENEKCKRVMCAECGDSTSIDNLDEEGVCKFCRSNMDNGADE